jgi:hypothetical protein
MNRTLVFCTAYSASAEAWTIRYRLWLNAILGGQIAHDHVLLIDDASPILPAWPDTRITNEQDTSPVPGSITLYRFDERLGRVAGNVYPGWSRSFCFAARFAQTHGFDKVVHVESDAFIISARMQQYINEVSDGWIAPAILSHHMPESAIQIMAGSGLASYFEFARAPYNQSIGIEAEHVIPFTKIERAFTGSRYGETMVEVPREADFVTQSRPATLGGREYYWWLRPEIFPFP